ncbi:SpoVR family protein [Paenalkalicoccus suaedae]|uniref:SpoVR family protein n=1 Tax=Paenalkalicoccus suaedae TaxID=2592382 RepID=A0A859FC92_9BACI|nr:SpoVR family protein [Paenalkalicoccus suaedae]QKS70687.1 SpoVR family protein [Paenalkalicoccus suaedae]
MGESENQLVTSIEHITQLARDYGLDFYHMRFEICPADVIYSIGAYGMPTRFTHWSFGKQFHRMKLHYDLGLSKIYELVINSDPCYAFLLDTNSLVQNKLIVAHVLAHSDFFKNNNRFKGTRKDMVESMSQTAIRISKHETRHGREQVESFIDDVLAIQEHIDPYESHYDERDHNNDTQDLLLFLLKKAKKMEEWQKDIMSMLREEMYYFWPQMETKIMNEGWATFWHQRIMRDLELNEGESIEFAKLHANVIQSSTTNVNPYHLGLRLFEYLEEKVGTERLFEIRETETDSSFLRNYLTKEFIQQEDLYVFSAKQENYEITSKDWTDVRDTLVNQRLNGGIPVLLVNEGDKGELVLTHSYEEVELDVPHLEKTLPALYRLWGAKICIETVLEGKDVLFSFDGSNVKKTYR